MVIAETTSASVDGLHAAGQCIVRVLLAVAAERGDCFAMVVVSRKERSGLPAGTAPLRELAA